MKNLSLFSLLAMLGMVLFMGGCQKDEIPEDLNKAIQQNIYSKAHLSLDSLPEVSRFLEKKLKSVHGRSSFFSEIDIDRSKVLIMEYANNITTYSMVLRSDSSSNKMYNLVIEQENELFTNIKVVCAEYYTPQFFSHSQYSFSEAFGSSGRSLTLKECIKEYYYVNEQNNSGNTEGNGGGGGGEVFDPHIDFTNTLYSWDWMNNYGNSGSGASNPDNDNSGGNGTGGGVIVVFECNCAGILILVPTQFGMQCVCIVNLSNIALTENDISSRSLSEECNNLLNSYGFLNEDRTIRTDEVIKECRMENPSVKAYLDEIKETYIDPCTGKSAINVDNLEAKMCFLDKYNIEDIAMEVDEALDGVDYVDDAELAENCPCVFAIWKQIKVYTQTNNLGMSDCQVLEILDDFIEGPLKAEFGVTVNSTGKIRATTYPNTTFGPNQLLFNTRIEINKDLCENSINIDPVSMAGTLLHEMVHARIYEHLYNSGYLTNSVGPNSALWSQFVQSNYPGITIGESQHQIMAQAFVNDIAQALHDINGMVGEPSDYLFLAWEGLRKSFTETQLATFDFIPDFDQLENNFNTNVKGKGVITYNNCN